MDIVTIFQTLFRWGVPALAGGIILLLVLAGGYLIYKKVLHGEKKVSRLQAACAALLFGWLILVICLTSFSRGSNFTGSINIDFMSGYISAWNHWSVSELQLIIFNMLMFAPLGFLLPLLWKKAEKFWVTVLVSFSVTALIEVIQFFTGTGIFELDDLFHNLVGSFFGYFCIMAVLSLVREKTIRFAPVAKMLLIPGMIGLTLGIVILAYAYQHYGNMSILPAVKEDMSEVKIVTGWEMSEQNTTAAIYQNKYAEDKNYVSKIKSAVENLENLTLSNLTRREDENLGYLGKDANGTPCRLLFFFRSGEWSYTNFAENAAQLTEEKVNLLKSRYQNWMKKLDLLPETAQFSVQNGDTLRWNVTPQHDIIEGTEAFQTGSVMIQFDESGTLSNFFYQITWNEYVTDETILSESQAFEQVKAGNFEQYVPFQSGDTLYIDQCKLTYVYDTKGFYQPVYEFNGYINQSDNLWSCRIPALQPTYAESVENQR